jgi:hypothetical protein
MKTIRIAQLILWDHLGSMWSLLLVSALLVSAIVLRVSAHSLAVAILSNGVLAILAAIIIAHKYTTWANRSMSYAFLVRPVSRASFLTGIIIAAWCSTSGIYLALRLISWAGASLSIQEMGISLLPVMVGLGLVVVLMTLLSPLVTGTEWFRTVFLVVVAASIYRDQVGEVHSLLRRGLDLFWMCFSLPILGTLNFSSVWEFELPQTWVLAIAAAEAVLLMAAALVIFSNRDLDWD